MKHMNRIQRDTDSLPTLANMYRCRFLQQKNNMIPSFSMPTFLRFLPITIPKVHPQAEGELVAKPKPSYKLRPRLYDTTWLGNAAFSLMILMISKSSINGPFSNRYVEKPSNRTSRSELLSSFLKFTAPAGFASRWSSSLEPRWARSFVAGKV